MQIAQFTSELAQQTGQPFDEQKVDSTASALKTAGKVQNVSILAGALFGQRGFLGRQQASAQWVEQLRCALLTFFGVPLAVLTLSLRSSPGSLYTPKFLSDLKLSCAVCLASLVQIVLVP
ncbi:MAG: hypothetical protein ACLPH3_12175 [Terracidiphilus sp.]